jgi:pyrimidine-nucleoside phosphorylase
MRVYDIITKKKLGEPLLDREIDYVIKGYVANEIPDYQISALLMAIYFNGMSMDELISLTKSMVESGDQIDLSGIKGIKADKHSTGGVGDKTSLVLLPLMASSGLKVSKMSGRGLGHTGGTIDKLESFPGFNISLSSEEMFEIVDRVGFAIAGQTLNLVPADKKLYALRDVTATVDSLPLIASSIMSKKIASGADYILLDVKIGKGAFMKDIDHAVELAKVMVAIGENFNRKTGVVLTNMEEPLGHAVGNSLEVIEAIDTLSGKGPDDFTTLCLFLNAAILSLTGLTASIDEGIIKTEALLKSGVPLSKFKDFVAAQGGDADYIDHPERFNQATYQYEIRSDTSGYIAEIDAEKIGICSLMAGAGRETKEQSIDHSAGIVLKVKVGDRIDANDILGTIYTGKENMEKELSDYFRQSIKIVTESVPKPQVIIGIVDKNGFKDLRKKG